MQNHDLHRMHILAEEQDKPTLKRIAYPNLAAELMAQESTL